MPSQSSRDEGALPRPPLLAVTGRHNTMVEFNEASLAVLEQLGGEDGEIDGDDEDDDEVRSAKRMRTGLDSKTLKLLQGSFKELPPMPTSIVRIFLSSTFSDFKAERNLLPRQAYPTLQSYCGQHGLDFQVVDMRWGVTDDVINDHQVSQLCINEIITCQQISCGPNFVALLGNRYGYQPFPAKISFEEFDILYSTAKENDFNDFELLSDWFKKDENAVPPEYILQPIPSKLKYYNDLSAENESKKAEDRKKWEEISKRLQELLRAAAAIAKDRKLITAEREHGYNVSVTEEEVAQGVFQSDCPNKKVLCYQRSLDGLIGKNIDQDAPKYMDLNTSNQIDQRTEKLRKKLLHEKLPQTVSETNRKLYEVCWKGKALEKAPEDYDDYLQEFCRDFVMDMMDLIDKNLQTLEDEKMEEVEGLREEVLHHSQFAKSKCELFCGREDEIKVIKNYLKPSDSSKLHGQKPFIVHTKSGYGKTALLAHVASHIHDWLGEDAILVLRFLGTSPQSSSIITLLKSIIQQICTVYKYKMPSEENLEMFSEVRRCMWALLKQTSKQDTNRPLVLMLDAVDQLQVSYGSHEFLWLMRNLPPNVFIIISMLSDRYHLVENVKARLGDGVQLLELPELPKSTGAEIIDTYLTLHKRRVTPEQHKVILAAFEKNRQALFLRLILDSARTWNSYTPLVSIHLDGTVYEAITALFVYLEVTYGKVFVQNALGYLTCGRGGLSPVEMEDVLSCDDDCLSEVYQYHDPPLEGIIRIPSLLWARVQDALQEYLTERQVDGKSVMAWYHRQFFEAAEKRFLEPPAKRRQLHAALAELFMQEDGIKKTVILHHRKDKEMKDADRCVTHQPLQVRNRRKLHALPYHLLHAGQVKQLKEKCLLNYEFIFIKLRALNIGTVFNQYQALAESELLRDEEDIQLFLDFLQMSYNALTYDPNLFAYHIKESLKNCCQDHVLLANLVKDAESWIHSCKVPLLLPSNVFNIDPANSPLKFSILIGYDGILTRDEQHMVCSWAEALSNNYKINCINLKTKDIVASVITDKPTPVLITKDERQFVYCENTNVKICEISSGDQVKRFSHLSGEYEKISVRCITLSNCGRYVAVAIRSGKPKNLPPSKNGNQTWKQITHIVLVDIEEGITMKEIEYHGRKHPDKIYFIQDDTQIMTSAKDKIIFFSMPDLDQIDVMTINYDVNSQSQKILREHNLLISGVTSKKNPKVCIFNFKDKTLEFSKNVHNDDENEIKIFGLCVKDDSSVILVGSTINTNTKWEESVCLWDRTDDRYSLIPLSHQAYKQPCSMEVSPDWSYAIVGWTNGYLAVVDLQNNKEISAFQGHGHSVYNITFFDEGRQFITMSQDHCLKLWDSKRQIAKCLESFQASNRKMEVDDTVKERWLDDKEMTLDIDTIERYIVTAGPDHKIGPELWELDGQLAAKETEKVQALYSKSLESEVEDGEIEETIGKNNMLTNPESGRTHGAVKVLKNGILLYERKRRDFLAMWTFNVKDLQNPVLLGHYQAKMAFFRLITQYSLHQTQKCYVIKDGEVEVLSYPELKKENSIEIPKITNDIPNIHSGGGKKKLMYYKVAATVDGKSLIIANPGAGKNKFFDLIDLETLKYVKRISLSRYVPWTALEDGCYFLTDVQDDEFGLYSPSKLHFLKKASIKSMTLIDSDKLLSQDRKLGFEIKDHLVKVWQMSPLKQLHVLGGHLHEVSTISVSSDNVYLATGSYDNTARIWSVSSGAQLCMFHAYGAIDKVVLTPSMSHLAVQCYAAPQQKRCLILKINNL